MSFGAAATARVSLAAVLCLAMAAAADAQIIKMRPFRGLFHTTRNPADSHTQIDFLTFAAGGLEHTTISTDARTFRPIEQGDQYGTLVFRGRLTHEGKKRTFGVNGGAATSYYSGLGGLAPFNLSAGGHYDETLGRSWSVSLHESFYYSPYFVFMPFDATASETGASALTPADSASDSEVAAAGSDTTRVDERATRLANKGYTTSAMLTRHLRRHESLFVFYSMRYVDTAAPGYDLLTQSPRVGYRMGFRRYASFVASYGITASTYRKSPFPVFGNHDLSVGLAYNRPFTSWRHTTYGFNFGTALIRGGPSLRVYLNGSGHINHQFGRNWLAGLNYVRGQQVLENFAQPFYTFADTGALVVSGRVFRQVSLSGRAVYTRGHYSVGAFRNVFDTKTGSLRVQVPVMWLLAAYAEGFYSNYGFRDRLGLLETVPISNERFGMRAGLTVSVPVLR